MDIQDTIFILAVIFICFCLGLGGFLSKKAGAYSPPYHSSKFLMLGISFCVFLFVGLFADRTTHTGEYVISYIFLFLGFVCLVYGIAVMVSKRANAFWWQLVRRNEGKNDRRNLIHIMFFMSFGFLFGFFVFYPPFM